MTNSEPLWRVMAEASTAIIPPSPKCYAAEIRALADWLLPEEEEPYASEWHDADEESAWGEWWARRRVRGQLLAEAKRAEAGE